MTSEAADILRKAKELIETKGWTQGAFARSRAGRNVSQYSPSAARFCTRGAIHRAASGLNVSAWATFDAIIEATGTRCLSDWNDEPGRTKAEVLSAFDRAIALAEAGNG